MWRRFLLCGLLAAFFGGSGPIRAQITPSGLISEATAQRYGLTRAWRTHVDLDQSRSRVAYVTQHVSSSDVFTVFELADRHGIVFSITERDLDPFGEPLGIAGAKERAEAKKKEMETATGQVKLATRTVPAVRLYVQTDHGALHALDGETGRTLWSVSLGSPDRLSLAPAANDQYVAATNGSTLYVLERDTGKTVWDRRLGGAPGAGPALAEDLVFVPLVNGRLEYYQLEKHRRPPWIFQGVGRAMLQPTVSKRSISWPTDRGYLFVARPDKRGLRYRFEADDAIVARSMHQDPEQIFVASVDGYVHALHELTGEILWRFSTGESISQPPVPIGDSVYVATDMAGMFCIAAETGREKWWTPQVRQFLAASNDRVYCKSETGRILIIDAKTGGRIDTMATEGLDLMLLNWQTDRIYVGTRSGALQCLHETQYRWPLTHAVVTPEEEAKPPVQMIEEKKGAGTKEKPVDNLLQPGGGDDNPFKQGGGNLFGPGGDNKNGDNKKNDNNNGDNPFEGDPGNLFGANENPFH